MSCHTSHNICLYVFCLKFVLMSYSNNFCYSLCKLNILCVKCFHHNYFLFTQLLPCLCQDSFYVNDIGSFCYKIAEIASQFMCAEIAENLSYSLFDVVKGREEDGVRKGFLICTKSGGAAHSSILYHHTSSNICHHQKGGVCEQPLHIIGFE